MRKTSLLIPLAALSKITKLVVTGHDHLPREIEANGMRVIVTGSMQPYAFGEEPKDEADPMYVTLTLDQLEQQRNDLSDRCVRVHLYPGETLPTDIDCLQLTAKKVTADGEEESLDVDLGTFDMNALFVEAFKDVDPTITAEMTAKFKELRHA